MSDDSNAATTDGVPVASEIAGKVWKLVASPGDALAAGDTLLILESMKMEIPVQTPVAGTLQAWLVQVDDMVEEDQAVARVVPG